MYYQSLTPRNLKIVFTSSTRGKGNIDQASCLGQEKLDTCVNNLVEDTGKLTRE